ncbi:SymE family type I addiction module toxin [Aureisphaera galaxeae]|uniref:SymE family type I addiction module toxin n=1 Tax=Aureisphaera galaxeae TaxID=1538023 RepID=UPI0023503171|nr:SymE family type I addiction module toxin [Aureisphaera galaxeae]MDC8003853.1 SymE family type I addiction module toxin [Aureisphaera galaxeae]
MNQHRKLKVYQKFRRREWDNLVVPEIRLEGIWLQELGFEIGMEIQVEQGKERLVITVFRKE